MKALSIRQPWAWAILHAGKDVENRDWGARSPSLSAARKVMNSIQYGGLFLIHASAGMTRREFEECLAFMHDLSLTRPFPSGLAMPAPDRLERGGIVGIARLVGIVDQDASPWFFGPVGLMLRDVRATKFAPLKGALGFFDVPDDIAREALAA